MTRVEAKAILENDLTSHVEGDCRFMDAFWMAVDALQTLEDIKTEIDQINEYDYPKDDRTISKFKNIVLEIIDKRTK